jgi:hypothetical protein
MLILVVLMYVHLQSRPLHIAAYYVILKKFEFKMMENICIYFFSFSKASHTYVGNTAHTNNRSFDVAALGTFGIRAYGTRCLDHRTTPQPDEIDYFPSLPPRKVGGPVLTEKYFDNK